jgi:hypothetical protein
LQNEAVISLKIKTVEKALSDVAKLLGDTVETVEKYYALYVRELRERARRFVESQEGLENVDTNWTQQQESELKTQ